MSALVATLGDVGVDSGQIAALAADRMADWTGEGLDLGWPGIVLKDGRHLIAGGKDFFHWQNDIIAGTGMSANALIEQGLAVQVAAVIPAVCDFSYSGACNATLSRQGFGPLLDKTQTPIGFAMSTAFGDGAYPIERRRLKVGGGKPRDFIIVDTSGHEQVAGSSRRPIVAIGAMRTGGLVLLCDPCMPRDGTEVPVACDPLGWSTVYGVAEAGGGRIVGLGFEGVDRS